MASASCPVTMFVRSTILVLILAGAAACGREQPPPRSLLDARAECARASRGVAMRVDPAAVQSAEVALVEAELAYKRHDPAAGLLATIAQRKAQLAESVAATALVHRAEDTALSVRQAILEGRAPPRAGATQMQPAK